MCDVICSGFNVINLGVFFHRYSGSDIMDTMNNVPYTLDVMSYIADVISLIQWV